MADNLKYNKPGADAGYNPGLGQKVDAMFNMADSRRRKFAQRWYDNNFFDDGHHFRYVSRETGKIVDLSQRGGVSMPLRAIPKASRQIRGVANLLMQPEYQPVIYPEKVSRSNFMQFDQATQESVLNKEEFEKAKEISKFIAQNIGHWITEEWKNQHLPEKMIQMILLAAKHGVSFLQVWPDAVEEAIKTQVYDAFDIYLLGDVTNIEDSPFVGKAVPKLLEEIKADERFDEEQRMRLNPDNKYANDEIKQAYMQSKYGVGSESDEGATVLLKEVFIKEYLNEDNYKDIASKYPDVVEDKQIGDMVMRHCFTAGGVWLLDEYVDLPHFPFIAMTLEPGPLYQTPLIERFIPQNKTLDMIISRVERWANTMVSGHWVTRKGEDISITNIPGGQKIEYETTPPVQGTIQGLPTTVFNFIELLESLIEEQGASTSALGQIPSGVKSGVAIESLKATEYANLKIASMQLKECLKNISERMLDIAADYFITPQTVMLLEKGEPSYFDIIGERGIEARRKAKIDMPQETIIIKKEYRVDINIETGAGFTEQGRRESVQQIATFMLQLVGQGMMTPEAVKVVIRELIETFKFGNTQEMMEALDDIGDQQLTEQQILQMKVALAEVIKDTGMGNPEQGIKTTKIGMLEAMRDLRKGGNNAVNQGQ